MTEEDSKSSTENENKSIPIRDNLVETAVNFLTNPNVINKPEHSKEAFLRNKGLTDTEISLAFHKVKSDHRYSTITDQNHFQNSFTHHPKTYKSKSYSFWSNLSSVSSSLIVIAVALYGLHRFYKLYIEPWLFGTKPEGDEMKELVKELRDSVLQLKDSVALLEGSIHAQKEQIDRVFLAEGSPYMPIPMAVAELKTEIGNVKSLLINRHQFPAVPKVVTSPSIPLWQLPDSEAKDEESKTEEPTEEPTPSTESAKVESEEMVRDDGSIDDKVGFDPVESLLLVGNGTNGVHDDSDDQSNSKTEHDEKVL